MKDNKDHKHNFILRENGIYYCSICNKTINETWYDETLKKEEILKKDGEKNRMIYKLEYIFESVKKSGTKNSMEQFIYTVEEIGEISEVIRCLNKDVRKKNLNKNDLAFEIGDTLITLYLITKFEKERIFYPDIIKFEEYREEKSKRNWGGKND